SRKRLERTRVGARLGKEQVWKHQRGRGVVEEEVVPLDCRSDRAGRCGTPHLFSLRARAGFQRLVDLVVSNHLAAPPVTTSSLVRDSMFASGLGSRRFPDPFLTRIPLRITKLATR